MIYLKNITISYKRDLIRNASITIKDNQITCLTGVSGSGKTSLLYLIGLLTTISDHEYYFNNNKLDFSKNENLALIRRLKIGYVFQDNNTLENLSIKENFNYIGKLCDLEFDDIEIKYLLSIVQLDKSLNTPTCSLSGGEKQRLAIALALSKNPELIILDEPTSALDKETSIQIMKVLQDIAHNHCKMIVIASHSEIVNKMCDLIYKIENKQILPVDQEITVNHSINEKSNHHISFKFYFFYIKLHLIKQYKLYSSIFLIISFIISACTISKTFSTEYVNYNLSKINQNEIEKIIVSTNQEAYQTCFYQEVSDNIDKNLIYSVINQNSSIKGFMFYKEWIIDEFYLNNIIIEKQAVVKPYKYNQELTNKIYSEYQDMDNSGIYISYLLLPDINNTYQKLDIILENQQLSFSINGISTAYDTNDLSLNKDIPIIYIPYEKIQSFLNNSSTCILYTSDKTSINKIITDIKQLDMTIGASSDYMGQTNLYHDAIDKVSNLIIFFSYTLYLLGIISIALIYFKKMVGRTYEISLLKANGMSNKEITKLILLESSVHLISIILLSNLQILLFQLITSTLLNYNFNLINLNIIFILIVLSIFTMLFPTLITLNIILKNDPVKTLRN